MPDNMIIYGWGFNALDQLCLPGQNSHANDVLKPCVVASAKDAQVVWTSWSDTILFLDGTAMYRGGYAKDASSEIPFSNLQNKDPSDYIFYGDHGGLAGYFEKRLGQKGSTAFSTKHVAVAGNGRVAVINFCPQACSFGPGGSYLKDFTTLEAFTIWRNNVFPIDSECRVSDLSEPFAFSDLVGVFIGSERSMQLEAGATGFTLLLAPGKVFTWGDPRYSQCLGRPIHGEVDAATLGPIPYLSELTVTKIASGGWMSGAVSSEEHGEELYVWGQSEPGCEKKMSVLKGNEVEGQEDPYVYVADVQIEGEEAKVVDFGIGAGHLVIAAKVASESGDSEKRMVFSCGQGEFGQLGVGNRPDFVEDLTELPALRGLKDCQVVCGSKTSFVIANNPGNV